MKTKLVLSALVSTLALSSAAMAQQTESDSLYSALKSGKFSFKTRTFYMIRTFESTPDPSTRALTFGGIMKYETSSYKNVKLGLAYYGNQNLGLYSGYEGSNPHGGTSLLERNTGDSLNFLGEAYLQYNISNTMIKVGRQQLATPLMNNHDLRALPSVYEAAIVRNTDIKDTMVELGYVRRYTGFTSKDNQFLDYNTKWGKDGLAYISLKNNSIQNLSIRAQYIVPVSKTDNAGNHISIEDYKYFDAKYNLPFGNKTYIKMQTGGNAYYNASDSTLIGAKIGSRFFNMLDATLLFDKISGNDFKAIESGPMYSDWQQGYSNYEPSTAYGSQLILHLMKPLSLKVGYVDVNAASGYNRDDFSEFNFDGKYAFTEASKLRVRYSYKDQKAGSSRESRQDFRIIYYLNF
jgi:hypothetical protein